MPIIYSYICGVFLTVLSLVPIVVDAAELPVHAEKEVVPSVSQLAPVLRRAYATSRVADVFVLPSQTLGNTVSDERKTDFGRRPIIALLLPRNSDVKQDMTKQMADALNAFETVTLDAVAPNNSIGPPPISREAIASSSPEKVVITASQGMSAELRNAGFQSVRVLLDKSRLAEQSLIPAYGGAKRPLLFLADAAGFLRSVETVSSERDITRILEIWRKQYWFAARIQAGQLAPDFATPDANGVVRRLSDLRGRRNVLVTFFPRCFTGGCANHLSSLQEAKAELDKSETEVWAVSVDPADGEKGQRAFALSLGLEFPLLPDIGRNLCILYGAANSPNLYAARMSIFIDKNGTIRWVDKQVDVKTHGTDVLSRLEQMNRTDKLRKE